jgi:hypothetical protein
MLKWHPHTMAILVLLALLVLALVAGEAEFVADPTSFNW